LKSVDTDGCGEINYTEFIAATINENIYMRDEYLRNAFNTFDKNKDGTINKEDLLDIIHRDDEANCICKH